LSSASSSPAGSSTPGGFRIAADLQGLPGSASTWIAGTGTSTVSEPGTMAIIGAGLLGTRLLRRRRTSR
jgi:hypothetical protein